MTSKVSKESNLKDFPPTHNRNSTKETPTELSLTTLEEQFQSSLVPKTSEKRYAHEWKKFEDFLTEQNTTVSERSLKAYVMYLHKIRGYAPTTIVSRVSMLKKMNLVHREQIAPSTWESVHAVIKNLLKNHVKNKAQALEGNQIEAIVDGLGDHPEDIQKKVIIIVGFTGGLRNNENHGLCWEDVCFKTDPEEIRVDVERTKTDAEGRYFLITNPKHIQIVKQYREIIRRDAGCLDGYFYKPYNTRYQKFCKTNRRGENWIQSMVKKLGAVFHCERNTRISSHSLRRGMATTMYANGANPLTVQRAGSWQSPKVVEGYIQCRVAEKRKAASFLSNSKPNLAPKDAITENPTEEKNDEKKAKIPKIKVVLRKPASPSTDLKGCTFSNCTLYLGK